MTDDPFMAVADHFGQLIEISAGHREKALAAGFSREVAEQMALQVHASFIRGVETTGKKS